METVRPANGVTLLCHTPMSRSAAETFGCITPKRRLTCLLLEMGKTQLGIRNVTKSPLGIRKVANSLLEIRKIYNSLLESRNPLIIPY